MGGVSEGDTSRVNRTMFNIYNEHACQWAEQIVRSGKSIDVDYSDQFWEVVEFSSKVAHKLTLKPKSSDDMPIEVSLDDAVPSNEASYEAIKTALLNDKVFLRQLLERLGDPSLQNQDSTRSSLSRIELERLLGEQGITMEQVKSALKVKS